MKRAFFVIGPEGCGTYMLAKAFVSAGCTYCDKDGLDEFLAMKQPDNIVVQRSLPHAGIWLNIDFVLSFLRDNDYMPYLFRIIRDQHCAEMTVMRKNPSVRMQYGKAMQIIGESIQKHPGWTISYEYFVTNPRYRKMLFQKAGLREPEMEFYDGNARYYG